MFEFSDDKTDTQRLYNLAKIVIEQDTELDRAFLFVIYVSMCIVYGVSVWFCAHLSNTYRSQKRGSEPLKLELQMVLRHHEEGRN